jgi:hypothetical protein
MKYVTAEFVMSLQPGGWVQYSHAPHNDISVIGGLHI